jgi:hypothetical protein
MPPAHAFGVAEGTFISSVNKRLIMRSFAIVIIAWLAAPAERDNIAKTAVLKTVVG